MTPVKANAASTGMVALAAIDWHYAAAVAFGLVSGWFCRAATPYINERPLPEIKRVFITSVMISGGSLLGTLWLARMLGADTLTAGLLAWVISFGGLDALRLVYNYVLIPIRQTIGKSPDEIMAERNQEAQKYLAAAKLAHKEIQKDQTQGITPDDPEA